MDENLKLVKLINAEGEYFETLVVWFYNWWGKLEGWSEEKVRDYLKSLVNKNDNPNSIYDLPEIYIALLDNVLVGTFSFTLTDCDTKMNLYPWLANLYVNEEYRGKHIANFLIKNAIKIAEKKNLKCIYLYTQHADLYEKYGFVFVDLINTFIEKAPYQRLYKLDLRDVDII